MGNRCGFGIALVSGNFHQLGADETTGRVAMKQDRDIGGTVQQQVHLRGRRGKAVFQLGLDQPIAGFRHHVGQLREHASVDRVAWRQPSGNGQRLGSKCAGRGAERKRTRREKLGEFGHFGLLPIPFDMPWRGSPKPVSPSICFFMYSHLQHDWNHFLRAGQGLRSAALIRSVVQGGQQGFQRWFQLRALIALEHFDQSGLMTARLRHQFGGQRPARIG